ncbi:MAG: hypothetical protein HDR20_12525 [Lachnospiraceae bacterium]|nr:hypothetical protein [Lachnospiraceae bacterium]
MFKEKLYSGTFTKASTTKAVTRVPETTTVTTNIEKTNIICNALLDFLTECGVDVSYEEESLIIYICGLPVIFYFQGSYMYYSNIYVGGCTIVTGSSTNTVIFNSSGEYKFKLTLIGEPTGFFSILISNMNLTYTASANQINFVNLENILENQQYAGINSGTNSSAFYVFKKTPILSMNPSNSNTTTLFGSSYTMSENEKNVLGNQGKYPLIQKFIGPYKLLNCYEFVKTNEINNYSTPSQSGGTFYKIDNKIYMTNSSYALVECVTP